MGKGQAGAGQRVACLLHLGFGDGHILRAGRRLGKCQLGLGAGHLGVGFPVLQPEQSRFSMHTHDAHVGAGRRFTMRESEYIKCSPGGNITSLVFAEVPREEQASVAKRIMASQPDVEQVGFVEKPKNPKAVARLQMMGGEFCGNATRSLAWVLWHKRRRGIDTSARTVTLEVSGVARPLSVEIHDRMVRLEMPIKGELSSIKSIKGQTVVQLEGISHVVLRRAAPRDAKEEANRLLDELGLKSLEAAGVLYCEQYEDGVSMSPIVWVCETATLVEETGCASGTVCVALVESANAGRSVDNLKVYQPSGSFITASVEFGKGQFLRAFIEGPVEILEEGELGPTVLESE
jgi:diaminopimelate epimerase